MNTLNLREMKQEAEKDEAPAVVSPKNDLVPRSMPFTVEYDAPDGNHHKAELVSSILDGEKRNVRARLFIKLKNGLTEADLGEDESARLSALANIATQLDVLPEWVEYWCKQDNELLAYINAILMEHEYRYFRGNSAAGEDGERQPRIRVNADALTKKPATKP
jgi:hypothetical protein